MLEQSKGRKKLWLGISMVLLLVMAAGIGWAALMAAQIQPIIPGLAEKVIAVPSARLAQFKSTKQKADVNLLRQTYFMRNRIPFIRLKQKEFALLPLEAMEFQPTKAQIEPTQKLSVPMLKYRDYFLLNKAAVGVIATSFVDHRSQQTSIKDQANRGTCVCFASLAGLERAYGGGALDLSENYANYLYMKAEGSVCKDDGLATHMSADYLSANGVCQESICPYQNDKYHFPAYCNNSANPGPSQRTAAENADPYRIKSYQKIWRKDDLGEDVGAWINNPRYLESLLREGKDIVFGTHVAGWVDPCTGILDVKLTPSGDPLPSVGGHAMLIVGYNRPEQYFIVKNSWGTDVGQDGYFYLSYDYLRTYAKYGYVINEVYPIITMAPLRMRALPAD